MTGIHPAVSAYERAVPEYRRGRPDYPASVIDWVAATVGVHAGSAVLDLGAGTGNLTRHLRRHVGHVVAVEPIEAFRRELARLDGVGAVAGTAAALPLRGGAFDLVAIGQAFHWFAEPRSVAEIGRVLRDRGWLSLVWNVRPGEPAIHAAVNEVLAPFRGRAPAYGNGEWKGVFSDASPLRLGPSHVESWVRDVDEPTFLARFLSVSVIAELSDPARAQVRRKLEDVFARFAVQGRLAMPYRTEVHLARHAENPE